MEVKLSNEDIGKRIELQLGIATKAQASQILEGRLEAFDDTSLTVSQTYLPTRMKQYIGIEDRFSDNPKIILYEAISRYNILNEGAKSMFSQRMPLKGIDY